MRLWLKTICLAPCRGLSSSQCIEKIHRRKWLLVIDCSVSDIDALRLVIRGEDLFAEVVQARGWEDNESEVLLIAMYEARERSSPSFKVAQKGLNRWNETDPGLSSRVFSCYWWFDAWWIEETVVFQEKLHNFVLQQQIKTFALQMKKEELIPMRIYTLKRRGWKHFTPVLKAQTSLARTGVCRWSILALEQGGNRVVVAA